MTHDSAGTLLSTVHGDSLRLLWAGRVPKSSQSQKVIIQSRSPQVHSPRSGRGHVTLTSRTWSSLLGTTRTCMALLELQTWPGGSACSRGIGKPLCSPPGAECTLPLLLTLLLSSWSSTCLSTDRLSFSIQLSAKRTGGERHRPRHGPVAHPGRSKPPELTSRAAHADQASTAGKRTRPHRAALQSRCPRPGTQAGLCSRTRWRGHGLCTQAQL